MMLIALIGMFIGGFLLGRGWERACHVATTVPGWRE